MEIFESVEAFKNDVGIYQLGHLKLPIHSPYAKDQIHQARCLDRFPGCKNLDISNIYELKPLSAKDEGPQTNPAWAAYEDPDLELQITHEADIHERLKHRPQPIVFSYKGYSMPSDDHRVFPNDMDQHINKKSIHVILANELLLYGRLAFDDSTKQSLHGTLGVLSILAHWA
ncbi:uncharacterized protein EAF01_008298 [Botrytis porri]|uniref:Uncharacterized protein n=1 Tax=Botrytis porri TaxID=87229 RepID=A0A4Z1KR74_9HELO|nr:uncharacterized protein EAF01_008298 [Botrytis porri]KAF7899085.1 hypothetical protein EAF01_008298 [Botrytis porri]TGO87522.1 hypothetical protein BPOR_0221g00190 [Botrytis porri]